LKLHKIFVSVCLPLVKSDNNESRNEECECDDYVIGKEINVLYLAHLPLPTSSQKVKKNGFLYSLFVNFDILQILNNLEF